MAVLLDTTVVSMAIGDLVGAFGGPLTLTPWVTTGYLPAMATAIPAMGWPVGRLGARN